jgi:hypothetical protein
MIKELKKKAKIPATRERTSEKKQVVVLSIYAEHCDIWEKEDCWVEDSL